MNLTIDDGDVSVYRVGCLHDNTGDWPIVRFEVNNFIKGILKATNATHYNGFLTDSSTCFRRALTREYNANILNEVPAMQQKFGIRVGVSPIKEYKINRLKIQRPRWYTEIRNHLRDHWKYQVVSEIEADDAINITFNHHYANEEAPIYDIDNLVISSTDKDFNQIPNARIYNPGFKTFKNITPEEAYYFHWYQMLRGDTADDIDGIRGIGDRKANSILFGLPNYKFEEYVKLEYLAKYGPQGESLFHITKKLLKFKDSHEGFSVPIPIEILETTLPQNPYKQFIE